MKKIGGFKLAINRKRGYYFEVIAIVISVFLLSLVIYAVVFSTGLIRKVFGEANLLPVPKTVFDLEGADKVNKIKNFPADGFESLDLISSSTPNLSPRP